MKKRKKKQKQKKAYLGPSKRSRIHTYTKMPEKKQLLNNFDFGHQKSSSEIGKIIKIEKKKYILLELATVHKRVRFYILKKNEILY